MSQFRRLAAIMMTDIVSNSSLRSLDEEKTLQLLEKNRKIQQYLVKKYGGQWAREMGCQVIMIFDNVLNAVQCAIEMQKEVRHIEHLFLKIAIHRGEIIPKDKDVLGEAVNLTARIAQIAQKDSILLSGSALSDIRNIKSIQTVALGDFSFKNTTQPEPVFAVVLGGLAVPDLSEHPLFLHAGGEGPTGMISPDDHLIEQVITVIENNLTNPQLSVSFLSQEVGQSQPQLYRKIQAGTNISPSDLIREVRLKKAAQLLKDNVGNVTEVAYQTGFNNLSYFSKCFLDRYGSLPSDYRKTAKIKYGLPIAVDKCVGRDQEIDDIIRILQRVRLLTLTGVGGTGKTRLANEVLVKHGMTFRDGACFVQLAPFHTPEAVVLKIAQVLKIQQHPSRDTLTAIIEFIADREVLLVLDNFEQVLGAAMEVNELIRSCPALKILVTSRVILNLVSETEYIVPQLSFPENDHHYEPVEMMQFPAVELLVNRAKAVMANFELTADNRKAVAAICAELDGLPLALQLAAARFKLFSPEALLRRLGDKLDMLSNSALDQPDRHKTLRSAIDWSYSLLSPEEQTLFRRLSVFSGGCTLEAAKEVCFHGYHNNLDIIDQITGLVDKSLLQREDQKDGEPRFYMLETIKAFGQDRLEKSLEKEDLMRRYVDHTVDMAEKAEKHLTGEDQGYWLDRLEPELDNIRSVLSWAEDSRNAEKGLKVAVSFWRYWNNRSMMREGSSWIQRMLAIRSDKKDSIMRCRALNAYGTLKLYTGQLSEAHAIFSESLQIAQKTSDKRGIANALTNLAWVCRFIPDIELCREYSKVALEIHTEYHDDRGIARVYDNLSAVEHLGGNMSGALESVRKAVNFRKAIGDGRSYAYEIANEAWLETFAGQFQTAKEKIDNAIDIMVELPDEQVMAWLLTIKAYNCYYSNEIERAKGLIAEFPFLWENEGNPFGVAQWHLVRILVKLADGEIQSASDLMEKILNDSTPKLYGINAFLSNHICALLNIAKDELDEAFDQVRLNLREIISTKVLLFISAELELMAHLLYKRHDFENGLLLFSQAAKLREKNQIPVSPARQCFYDNTLCQLKSHFDSSTFASVWEKGRNFTPEECLTLIETSH
jgi:predicted ATPase/AraC-like DNA-binding protein/class 3 adenylate cyclase